MIDVAPDHWHRPYGGPPDIRLRMEVDAASLHVDDEDASTGWAWLFGRRLLPGGGKRPGKALVRIAALPGELPIRHHRAVVKVADLRQTACLDLGPVHGI